MLAVRSSVALPSGNSAGSAWAATHMLVNLSQPVGQEAGSGRQETKRLKRALLTPMF